MNEISEIKHFIENFKCVDDSLERTNKALDLQIEDQKVQLLQKVR